MNGSLEPHVRDVLQAEQERFRQLEQSLVRCIEIGKGQLAEREHELANTRSRLDEIAFALKKPVYERVPA